MPEPGQHVFSEKVALVTNGHLPIGRAVSMQLGLYGAYVIVTVPPESEDSDASIDELKSLGTLAHSIGCDTSRRESVRGMVSQIESIYGRLDLVVNYLSPKAVTDFADEDLTVRLVRACVAPVMNVTEGVLPLVEERPKARFVNIVEEPGDAIDTTSQLSKAFAASVRSLTESFPGLLPQKVQFNSVVVGDSKASRESEDLDPELFRPRSAVDPDDVARSVIYFLSSESKGVNGQVLKIG